MPVSTCPLCGTTPHECRFMEPAAPVPVPAAEREEAAKWCESVANGGLVIAVGTMMTAENKERLRLAAAALRGK